MTNEQMIWRGRLIKAVVFGLISVVGLALILMYVVIPIGIASGNEFAARMLSVYIFYAAGIGFFGVLLFLIYKLNAVSSPSKLAVANEESQAEPTVMRYQLNPPKSPAAEQSKGDLQGNAVAVVGLLGLFGFLGLVRLGLGIGFLLFLYGIVVIVFRHAFGVHLWNPFG